MSKKYTYPIQIYNISGIAFYFITFGNLEVEVICYTNINKVVAIYRNKPEEKEEQLNAKS